MSKYIDKENLPVFKQFNKITDVMISDFDADVKALIELSEKRVDSNEKKKNRPRDIVEYIDWGESMEDLDVNFTYVWGEKIYKEEKAHRFIPRRMEQIFLDHYGIKGDLGELFDNVPDKVKKKKT